jgi:hypothetical protein
LWRLRRASAIETGLFELQGEALPARRQDPSRAPRQPGTPSTRANGHSKVPGSNGRDDTPASDQETLSTSLHPPLASWSSSRTIAQCFLRLCRLDPTLLDRVGSYEVRLWRQAAQTIWTRGDATAATSNAATIAPSGRALQLGSAEVEPPG